MRGIIWPRIGDNLAANVKDQEVKTTRVCDKSGRGQTVV